MEVKMGRVNKTYKMPTKDFDFLIDLAKITDVLDKDYPTAIILMVNDGLLISCEEKEYEAIEKLVNDFYESRKANYV
jgi:hypothetical protein